MENGAPGYRARRNVREGFYRMGGTNPSKISRIDIEGIFKAFFLNLCHVHVRNVKEMALYSARRALPVGEAAEWAYAQCRRPGEMTENTHLLVWVYASSSEGGSPAAV